MLQYLNIYSWVWLRSFFLWKWVLPFFLQTVEISLNINFRKKRTAVPLLFSIWCNANHRFILIIIKFEIYLLCFYDVLQFSSHVSTNLISTTTWFVLALWGSPTEFPIEQWSIAVMLDQLIQKNYRICTVVNCKTELRKFQSFSVPYYKIWLD